MMVVDYKAGQLANRLFHFSYFIAHSLEYDYKLINPCFEEYKDLFYTSQVNNFSNNKVALNFSNYKWIDLQIKKILAFGKKIAQKRNGKFYPFEVHDIRVDFDHVHSEFDMSDHQFIKKVQKKILFARGWNYRDKTSLHKHKALIKKIFTIKKIYLDEVQEILSTAKANGNVCIGVHIRKGDYKNFFDGRWYYNDAEYASKLGIVQNIFTEQGKNCVFLVCSNEVVKQSSFPGMNIISAERSPVVDLYALAGCDYLIGPPSTFTMWASFYGDVPLLVLKNKDTIPQLKDFKVAEGVESFF